MQPGIVRGIRTTHDVVEGLAPRPVFTCVRLVLRWPRQVRLKPIAIGRVSGNLWPEARGGYLRDKRPPATRGYRRTTRDPEAEIENRNLRSDRPLGRDDPRGDKSM